MKTFLLISLMVLAPLGLCGQNLVPNGSFEEYSECPDNGGQIERAANWIRIQGTPEYYNRCSDDPAAAVPNNKLGYQSPHGPGDAYAGIIAYSDSDWFTPPELLREIIGVELFEPLLPGVPVYVSFWVSPGAFGMPGTQVRWTTSGVGLRLAFGPLVSQAAIPASNDAEVQLESVLLDTAGWTLVSGTVIPDAAYDAITIGNFVSDSLLMTHLIDSTGTYGIGYVYVDDVVVSYQHDGYAGQFGSEITFNSWYDIASDRLCVTTSKPSPATNNLSVVNAIGMTVATLQLPGGSTYAELPCLIPPGVYWILLDNEAYSMLPVSIRLQTK